MNVISRQEAEKYLSISIESGDTTDQLITQLSNRLADYCDRGEWGPVEERTEHHDGATQFILAKVWPIAAIASVNDDPDHEWVDADAIDADGYYAGKNGVVYYEYGSFSEGNESVRLIYSGGYADVESIPQRIKDAALIQLKNEYLGSNPAPNMQPFEQHDDEGLLPEVRALLENYRRKVMF